jgi:hypothetical protein
MHILEVELRMSTAFRPQTDGANERMNSLIVQIMRNLVNLHQDNWTECLPATEFAINSHQNITTKKAPFELVYGCIPNPAFLNNLPVINIPQAEILVKDLQDNWKTAHEIATTTREYQAKWYNAKYLAPPKFEVGQKVLLNRKNINTKDTVQNKLSPLFIGPFKIIKAYPEIDDYKLQLPKHLQVYPVFHVSLLCPFHPNDDKQFPSRKHARPPPIPDLEDQEEQFEALTIVDSRYSKRTKQYTYKVHWKGYPASENTWESASNLTNAKELIEEFNQHYSTSPAPKRRRATRKK